MIIGVSIIAMCLSGAATADRSETMRMSIGIVATKYEFPYLCTVVYHQTWVGACAILTAEVVIVSVSNLNKPIRPYGKKMFYNDISGLSVYAGSIYMNPSLYQQKNIVGLQETKANSLFVAYKASNLKLTEQIRPPKDKDFSLSKILEMDAVGVAFNVAFLKVSPFKFTDYVRPLPLKLEDVSRIELTTTRRISALQMNPYSTSNCKIAGWHFPTSRMVFHHVLYVPMEMCKQAYCNYNLNTCLKFPEGKHLVCFKSAHWGEPCARDTGAALFCRFFEGGNIFGILTTAINCGQDNLPCVYTTMPPVLQVYETLFGKYSPPVVPP